MDSVAAFAILSVSISYLGATIGVIGDVMAPMAYHVGSFTDVAMQWGERLWALLNEPESIRSMIRASDEGRTAAEGVAQVLAERLGVARDQRRVKMFIGYLIRQVMERQVYVLDKKGQPCRQNPLFTKAARYTRQ